mmetsp:Transcript_143265/g.399381  ORF Transcript_143265/g.399381 Transcript_143265/m.399381 type:complete len:209 (-) Transcript_143265:220-846(-)
MKGLLILLAKVDLLRDEDVVRIWPADVCEVILGRLEGKHWPEEAVDGTLLKIGVPLRGCLHPPHEVSAHLLCALNGPRHLHEELCVQAFIWLGIFHGDEGLWPSTPGSVLRRGGKPPEVDDAGDGVVGVQRSSRMEGLGEPSSSQSFEFSQRRRDGKAIAIPVEHILRLDLHLLLRQAYPRRRYLDLAGVELRALGLHQLAPRLKVTI